MLEVSGFPHKQQQQLIKSPNTNLSAFMVSSGTVGSVWTGVLGACVYLLLPCHLLYQLKRTHTHTLALIDPSAWSTVHQADTDSNQMFRGREQCELQMPRWQSTLLFLSRSNWLAPTGARSLESPPRSLDMEIYRKEGGELFRFYCAFSIWPFCSRWVSWEPARSLESCTSTTLENSVNTTK